MDYIIKEALKFIGTTQKPIETVYQHLLACPHLPSFLKEDFLNDPRLHIENNMISNKKAISRLKLYIEDKEYLKIVEEIYQQILLQPNGLNYQELATLLPTNFKLNQISHYCRKLYNHNLVDITCKSHFKQVKARKYQEHQEFHFNTLIEETNQPALNYYREFNFLTNLMYNISGNDGLRLQEIMTKMDKTEEGKSFSRLIEILTKEKCLNQQAERIGKIFTYKYAAKTDIKKWPCLYPQLPTSNLMKAKVIQFNQETMLELHHILNVKLDNDTIAKTLNEVMGAQNKRKSQISRSKMNRFACICNIIQENLIVTVKDLKAGISSIEIEENNGIIDTRTIKNYLKILQKIEFCKIHIVRAKIVSKECQRLLISHNSVADDDQRLISAKECLKLIEYCPQQQQSQQQQVKQEQSQLNHNQYDVNEKLEQDDIFQGDESSQYYVSNVRDQKMVNLLDKVNKILEKGKRRLVTLSFQNLWPKYDLQVVNEIFKRQEQHKCLNYLIAIEQKIFEQNTEEIQPFDDWEIETLKQSPQNQSEIKKLEQKQLSEKQFKIYSQFQKDKMKYASQKQVAEHLKNYLLRYPEQSLHRLHSTFPQLNLYVLLNKLIVDNTIEVCVFKNSQINVMDQNKDLDDVISRYTLDNVNYRVNSNYLAYFM